jgi:hypothetical protein
MRSNIFRNPDQIRYSAQLAYREGKSRRARHLNKIADRIEAVDRYPSHAASTASRIAALGVEGARVITRNQPSFERAVTTGGTVAACLTLSAVSALGLLWFAAPDTAVAYDGPYIVTADR